MTASVFLFLPDFSLFGLVDVETAEADVVFAILTENEDSANEGERVLVRRRVDGVRIPQLGQDRESWRFLERQTGASIQTELSLTLLTYNT